MDAKVRGLEEILDKTGISGEGPPLDAKSQRRLRKRKVTFRSATRFLALGAGLTVALQTVWTLEYDARSRGLIEASQRQEEVARQGHSPIVDVQPIVAVTFLTATGSQTWSVPADWNNTANTVEIIGSGKSGSGTTGGGGGAYVRKADVTLTRNGTASYFNATANSGADSWFGSNTTVLADGAASATGGQAANCIGDVAYDGGDASSGGGAAAGPDGPGGNASGTTGGSAPGSGGGNGGTVGSTPGTAGTGANGSGGGTGGAGQPGTYWEGTHGPGGGGGRGGGGGTGGAGTFTNLPSAMCTAQPGNGGPGGVGGAGGLYGGGGGGGGPGGSPGSRPAPCSAGSTGSTGTPGVGRQGLIVLSWTPYVGGHRMFMVF